MNPPWPFGYGGANPKLWFMNHVYFIGAGPGDPDLLTLKGAGLLRDCPTVFAFPPYEETFAALLSGKSILDPFEFYFGDLLQRVEMEAQQDNVGFLVPGDLTFFSPFQAVIDHFADRAQVIPGVGTVNAASARLKRTLILPGTESRAVIASPRLLGEEKGIEELAAAGVTLILYMNDLPLDELVSRLRSGYGKNVALAIISRLGLPGEYILSGTLDDIAAKAGGRDFFSPEGGGRGSSLTLVIAGEGLAASSDATWWDRRRSLAATWQKGPVSNHRREDHGRNS